MNDEFRAALAAIDSGDVGTLRTMLAANPDLVRARAETSEPPYNGYFHNAALLHHVAGNPVRGDLPANIVEITQTLLDAGADVGAECGGGPDQPDTGGGNTLGLVASGARAAEQGLSEGLIDTLIGAGADVNAGNGGCLMTALYHTVECPKQREVAEMLFDRGAKVDLCYAAGLGKLDLVKGFFNTDRSLKPDAYRLWRFPNNAMERPNRDQVIQEAFVYACINGRQEVGAFLLEQGARLDVFTPVSGEQVTPLHAAAWAGWEDMARFLLERGADLTIRDPNHNATALGWANYCGRSAVTMCFLEDQTRLDLADCVECGLLARVQTLLGDGDPDQPVGSSSPGALLRIAAYEGQLEVARYLLERGADPNRATPDGKTALDYAIEQEQDAFADLLREHGATEARSPKRSPKP